MTRQPKLAEGASFPPHEPDKLYFGCIDARVRIGKLNLKEGTTLIDRKIGGLLYPNDPELEATLEFAVKVKKVKEIIVSGHLDCGAVGACVECNPQVPKVLAYMSPMNAARDKLAQEHGTDRDAQKRALEKEIVKANLATLRSFEIVREAEKRGDLKLTGWLIDVQNAERGDKSVLNEATGEFVPAPPVKQWRRA